MHNFKTLDLRSEQSTTHVDKPLASFYILGEEVTFIFSWCDFQMQGSIKNRFNSWSDLLRMADAHAESSRFPQMSSTDAFLDPQGNLLIDAWRDDWKWGRARSSVSPETVPYIKEAIARGVIRPATQVYLGNWASLEKYSYLGVAGEITSVDYSKGIQVWHGTSSKRLTSIRRNGIKPNVGGRRQGNGKPNTVYFSSSWFRAKYFAEDTARCDNKGRDKKLKPFKPVILVTVISPDRYTDLIADDDWNNLCLFEKIPVEPSNWKSSFIEFGQIGMLHGFDKTHLVTVDTNNPLHPVGRNSGISI
jgi:hypothetical protein